MSGAWGEWGEAGQVGPRSVPLPLASSAQPCFYLLAPVPSLPACLCFTEMAAAGLIGPATEAWGFKTPWWVRKGVLEQSSLGPAAGEQEVEHAQLQLPLQSRLALW